MMYHALMQAAERVRRKAYCPYSHFAVGAALLAENGTIYTGCNVENASYSLGCCAERVAFFKAVSDGQRKFQAIAICGAPEGEEPSKPCPPCGACRQVMAQFCGDDFEVVLSDRIHLLGALLPTRFKLE